MSHTIWTFTTTSGGAELRALTVLDVVTEALQEIGVINPSDAPSGEEASIGLAKINAIFDNWNAERAAVYRQVFTTYTLTPGLTPHTIGEQSATLVASLRPVTIESATLVATGTPLRVRDAAWWASRTERTMSGTPTDVYYDPAWPNGDLYFWPVPSSAFEVEIESRVVLASVGLGDQIYLPPGYRDALTLTLAEALITPFRAEIPPLLPGRAREARARIFRNNVQSRRIRTAGYGHGGGRFDYRTGTSH